MKKIAVVTPFGAEERLDVFAEFIAAKGLAQKGNDVRLFTYRIRTNPEYVETKKIYKGIPVTRCSQRYGFSPRIVWEILTWRPEVVILCHIRSWLSLPAYLAARLVGAKILFQVIGLLHDPHVVEDRDNPLETIRPEITLIHTLGGFIQNAWKTRRVLDAWENYAFHMPLYRSDERIVITEFERSMLKKVSGLDAVVIPWGVPPRDETIKEQEPRTKEGKAMPEDFLFYIGQVKKRKGWDTIIEALGLLKRRGIRRELVFVTSSGPDDFAEAAKLVKEQNVEDLVTFLFNISNEEKAWLYARAKATLAPSRYEGFGLTVFESFVYGVPVLGTDIPVYDEFLIDGETGLVSKKGDPITFADNVLRLDDEELVEKIIFGGYKKAQEYTDDMIVERFAALV
ncbi:MAG: glycosyltransferase family 4 protein [Patescibacteria group bacterium]|jgi:glycosyltransferase involved in cell wall biosynthesis